MNPQTAKSELDTLQGYLAHKKTRNPLGPPYGPRHGPNVGSYEAAVSHERGSLVPLTPDP